MSVEGIQNHEKYQFRDSACEDLYADIMALIQEYGESAKLSANDAVGVLEWAKTTIILMNTEWE